MNALPPLPAHNPDDWCDGRLWLEDFDKVARAFIEAMPAERRAAFDRIFFSSGGGIEDMGHYVPEEHKERGVVYLVFVKGGRYSFFPLARPYVQDVEAGGPAQLLERAEFRDAETDANKAALLAEGEDGA